MGDSSAVANDTETRKETNLVPSELCSDPTNGVVTRSSDVNSELEITVRTGEYAIVLSPGDIALIAKVYCPDMTSNKTIASKLNDPEVLASIGTGTVD